MSNETVQSASEVISEATESTQPNQEVSEDGVEAELESALEGDQLSKEEKKEVQKQLKKFKLKVDGEEYEEEIDLSDEETIKKHLQMSKAAQKRMKEVSELRKGIESFLDTFRSNPRQIMKELGLNEKELAQAIINEEIAEMEKTPEQKEIDKLKRELEERIKKEKEDEENRKKSEMEKMQAEAEQKLETDITGALETGGLPKTPYTVKKMAEIMYEALKHNIDLSPKDVVPMIKKQMEQDIKELFSASSDDVLEEMLKEHMPRIRKRNVQKHKQKIETAKTVQPTIDSLKPKTESKEDTKQTIRGFFGI